MIRGAALHHEGLPEFHTARDRRKTGVRGHAVAGSLSEADLSGYVPKQREPICTVWRLQYRVCGFPPPSSGHLALTQILGILECLPAAGQPSAARPSARARA